jgi:O-antigen ligase
MIASQFRLESGRRRDAGTLLAATAPVVAALVGAMLAHDLELGAALVVAVAYVGLALVSPPIALVVWVPMVFFDGVPALNTLSKGVAAVLAAACVAFVLVQPEARRALTVHRPLFALLTSMVLWFTLSLGWSADRSRAFDGLWQWWAVAVLFVVVTVCVVTPRHLRLVAAAFVVGAVLSVAWSALHLGEDAPAGRLAAAAADPNSLAAGLVPAAILAAVSLVLFESVAARLAIVVALGVLAIGLVATGSRGGFVAAVVALGLAFPLFSGRRRQVVALAVVAATFAAGAFAVFPQMWERATNVDDSGGGRTELWHVAVRIFEDHPIAGVGISNFPVVSPRYVREPGVLERVDRLAEDPKAVHSIYLEKLAETGLIGTAALLVMFGTCIAMALRAAGRFETLGMPRDALLARGIALATAAMLTSLIFVSASVDRRLWILCALGPAAWAVTHRLERARGWDDHG